MSLLNLAHPPRVPNLFPSGSFLSPHRIALIGEAPGDNEVAEGKPFVGASGKLLARLCADAGINFDHCFRGNVCQFHPKDNDFSTLSWPELVEPSIMDLRRDLAQFKPNLCVLTGNIPLHISKSTEPYDPVKNQKKKRYSISNWRGSVYIGEAYLAGYKCLATYHPASLFRVFSNQWQVRYDMRKAAREGRFAELRAKPRNVHILTTIEEVEQFAEFCVDKKALLGIDIEGGCWTLSCIGFAHSDQETSVIPFAHVNGNSFWTDFTHEARAWTAVRKILSNPDIPKVLQFGLYDRFVLAWSYKILIRGEVEDTLMAHWELFNESDKDLGTIASIYTDIPYYKEGRVAEDDKTFWTYCGLDTLATLDSFNVMKRSMHEPLSTHYAFNKTLQDPFLFMELTGIRYDDRKASYRLAELEAEAEQRNTALTAALGVSVNVRSPKQMQHLLYEVLKLPVKYKRGKRNEDGSRKVTTEYDAVLELAFETKDTRLMDIIRLREVRKRISDIHSLKPLDGRVYFSYSPIGTITGRTSCSTSPNGSGTNGQTVVEANAIFKSPAMQAGVRDLLCADEDFYLADLDLSGADGWTVAADCAMLGDTAMLEDLLFGLKVPKLIALTHKYGPENINSLDRPTLKRMSEEVNKKTWQYFASKQVQHGTNYGMTPSTVALRVFLESYGEVHITEQVAAQFQRAYLARYKGVSRRFEYIRDCVARGYLQTAAGTIRKVFDHPRAESTVKSLLSSEPQTNTTYLVNLALQRMWNDPANIDRTGASTQLRVRPTHQVHDALLSQFRAILVSTALPALRSYFDNPIVISKQRITIPFEGQYGLFWGDKIGEI